MSRVHQRVLRAVRLLPQAVKIGIAEPDPPEEEPEPQRVERPRSASPRPRPSAPVSRAPRRTPPSTPKPQPPAPDRELLKKIEELEASLSAAEAQNAELAQAKSKLESEIDGVKADYEGRKRELEANAASQAAKVADEARAKAKEEGWNAGHSEGLAAAQAEVKKEYLDRFSALVSVLEGINGRLEEDFSKLVALNQPRMIRVWTEMLRRMLHRQVELHPDTINIVLSDLLSRLSDKSQIVIYAAPDDIAHLEADMDAEFREVLRGVHHLDLKADLNVEPGSCIVETSLGVYDARWRTQMGQVESVVDNIFQQVAKENRESGEAQKEAGA
ncbi:MAG: hypothetical protein IJ702_09225 [Fretibacterium sp.]|nr:hypothetical protein [Fretibacterium sp.]